MNNMIPGFGADSIHFGVQKNKIISIMGYPDIEYFADNGDEIIEYLNRGSFHFSAENQYRLVTIDCGVTKYLKIQNKNIYDMSVEEVLSVFNDQDYELVEIEPDESDISAILYFYDATLTIFFDNNEIAKSVFINPHLDEFGNYIW